MIQRVDSGWAEVKRELDRWADRGLTAKFWIRDDDAIQVSTNLERLRDLAATYSIQIGLAVITGKTLPDLAAFLGNSAKEFYPMSHGWKHDNHSRSDKPAEFGADRPISSLIADARSAINAFNALFRSTKAIFVPPFNCATNALVKALPNIGYFGVSLMPGLFERTLLRATSQLKWLPPVGIPNFANLPRIDVHLDLINWKTMKAQDADIIVGRLLQHLRGRRLGLIPADTPIGLLTHHLVHDDGIWSRCEEAVDILQSHASAKFVDVGKWADEYVPQGRRFPSTKQGTQS